MITPLPGATPLKPGSCTFPLPGIIADIVDETGHAVEFGKGGILVIKRPWPAMIRTIWGDPDRFKKSYYPEDFQGKYYLAGDGASRDLERLLPDHGPHRRRAQRVRATGSARWRSSRRSSPIRWSPKPRSSAVPTTSPARRCARSSC